MTRSSFSIKIKISQVSIQIWTNNPWWIYVFSKFAIDVVIFSYGVSTLPMKGHEAIIIYWQIPKILTTQFSYFINYYIKLYICKRTFLKIAYYIIARHSYISTTRQLFLPIYLLQPQYIVLVYWSFVDISRLDMNL